MRSIPNMTVVVPADGLSAGKLVTRLNEHQGPVYMRLSRVKEKTVYREERYFDYGKGHIIREPAELTLITCGASSGQALKAVDLLAERGIHVGLVDMPFIKPLDSALLREVFATAKKVITVEEHSIIGGLGSAVAEEIASNGNTVQIMRLGIPDEFTKAGPYEDLIRYYGLDAEGIARSVTTFIGS